MPSIKKYINEFTFKFSIKGGIMVKKKKKSSKKSGKKSKVDEKKRREAFLKAKEKLVKKIMEDKGLSKEDAEKIAETYLKKMVEEGGAVKMLEKYLEKEDAKAVDKYVTSVVSKFGKYIKSVVLFGSKKTKKTVSKKKKTNDIDIAVIIDDTDVRKMTRSELKDKLFQRLLEIGHPISKKLHPQPYLLTEFWQYVMEGNPVIYNLLRDGVILYDAGFFMPMQMLMKMGYIKPSKESIDKHMYVATKLVSLAKDTMLKKIAYNLEQAIVSSGQAVLMELGYRPPAPNEVPKFVEDVLVKKEKLVAKKYAKIAKDVIKNYKDIEHGDKKEYTGKEWDKHQKNTEEFVKKMEKLLKKMREDKGETFLFESKDKKNQKKKEVTRHSDVNLKENEKPDKKAEELITKELAQR